MSLPESSKLILPSSSVATAVQLLRDCRDGNLKRNWNSMQLKPSDYEELWRYLETKEESLWGYVEDKVHLDYFPDKFEFVVRTSCTVHQIFLSKLESAIQDQLDVMKNGNSQLATIADRIRNGGSASVHFANTRRHDPDRQFYYMDVAWPALIIEFADFSKQKHLGKLADEYILESDGSIKMVLGINIDNRRTKKATVSLWRPSYGVDEAGTFLESRNILVHQEFRKPDGTPVKDQTLRLPLQYFIPSTVLLPPSTGEQEITISYEKLAHFLDRAEAFERDRRKGYARELPAGTLKRRREETPPESLS